MWSPDATRGYDAWKAYLDVFDEVTVLARGRYLSEPPNGWIRVCGPGVRASSVPHFRGPWQLAVRYLPVKKAIREALLRNRAISMRLPATLSQLVWSCVKVGRTYGVHVTGDPFAALAPGLHTDLSRPLFRRLYAQRLLRQSAGACAVAYVTSESLQKTYPPPPGVFSTHFSNALLPHAAYVPSARAIRSIQNRFKVVMVGSLAHLIKGPDVLIESVGLCVRQGLNVVAVIVGDGMYRARMEARSSTLGLKDRVSFTGQLCSADEVRARLDDSDLFVLPSKTEGLPRAMLEAMARALPCIGTAVGGIPELLDAEDLVEPGDARSLARKILDVSSNPERLATMSARCLHKARTYCDADVRQRRNAYCQALRQATERTLSMSA